MGSLPLSIRGLQASDVAVEAAKKAGVILQDGFRRPKRVAWKGKSNIVTDADLAAEKAILDVLVREFPGHSFLTEENGSTGCGSDYTWIVDPLDGTNNYVFGIPLYCVSVSLARGGSPVLGVIYDPVHEELFCAERGGGAFLNDSPMAVSTKSSLEMVLLGFDMGYDIDRARETLDTMSGLWPGVHSLRILGSGALGLAYAACGRLDVYAHRCLFPWDISAGILLVEEAGGIVTDWEGRPAGTSTSQILASSHVLHRQFLQWHTGRSGQAG
jgi:myo-inositol-1(or 4)-monophosphatase